MWMELGRSFEKDKKLILEFYCSSPVDFDGIGINVIGYFFLLHFTLHLIRMQLDSFVSTTKNTFINIFLMLLLKCKLHNNLCSVISIYLSHPFPSLHSVLAIGIHAHAHEVKKMGRVEKKSHLDILLIFFGFCRIFSALENEDANA